MKHCFFFFLLQYSRESCFYHSLCDKVYVIHYFIVFQIFLWLKKAVIKFFLYNGKIGLNLSLCPQFSGAPCIHILYVAY